MLQDKKMPTGMVSVTMSGFPCLAVSYRYTITTVSHSSHFSVIAIPNYEFVKSDKITSETWVTHWMEIHFSLEKKVSHYRKTNVSASLPRQWGWVIINLNFKPI